MQAQRQQQQQQQQALLQSQQHAAHAQAHPIQPAQIPQYSRPAPTQPAQIPQLTSPQQPKQPSSSLEIARLVTAYLGPHHPRPESSIGATLNALRTRLETQTSTFDTKRDILSWQVREAIRTEFFKIIYPTPPRATLLALVSATEILLTNYPSGLQKPFFFPGGRVAVPTEAGSRRAATCLQLRYKVLGGVTVTEALLHLDGPNGGGFQWVQTQALTPLPAFVPRVPAAAQTPPPPPQPQPQPVKKPPRSRKRAPTAAKAAKRPPRTRKTPVRAAAQAQTQPTASTPPPPPAPRPPLPTPPPRASTPVPVSLPPPPPQPVPNQSVSGMVGVVARLARQEASAFHVPRELLDTSAPPRAKMFGEEGQLSHASGSLRRAFDGGLRLAEVKIIARRRVICGMQQWVEYYCRWGGRGGSWERRENLMKDVPGLVRQFDVRKGGEGACVRIEEVGKGEDEKDEKDEKDGEDEKDEEKEEKETEEDEEEGAKGVVLDLLGAIEGAEDKGGDMMELDTPNASGEEVGAQQPKRVEKVKQYVDDVTGISIPAWLDTPILEIHFSGMLLQIRRPGEASLHNDVTSAVKDAKKRQARFKQENIQLGERLFPLTKMEARSAIEGAARIHRLHNRLPIPFPRGIGRVSVGDHGTAFAEKDVMKAPASWEAYFVGLRMRCVDFERLLPPHMPNLDDAALVELSRVKEELFQDATNEHRERARMLLRDRFRHTGAPPPTHLFRDGVRVRPGAEVKKRRKVESEGGEDAVYARAAGRDAVFESALAAVKGRKGRWYDEVWGCWRAE